MKTPPLILIAMALLMVSCTTLVVENPDGTKSKLTLLGTDAEVIEVDVPNGRLIAQGLNNSDAFKRGAQTIDTGMLITGTTVGAMHSATQKTKQIATQATTDQTAIKAAAQVDTAAIKATSETAQSVGNNPEANSSALGAVGRLFRR